MDLSTHEQMDETNAAAAVGSDELMALCNNGFAGDTAAAALALGRDEQLITDILNGDAEIDDDLQIKINDIAEERGINLGSH